jgi:hypothetical protein
LFQRVYDKVSSDSSVIYVTGALTFNTFAVYKGKVFAEVSWQVKTEWTAGRFGGGTKHSLIYTAPYINTYIPL